MTQSMDVKVGQVAPRTGQFCIDTNTFSLLQRSLGLHDASAVEATLLRKNDETPSENGEEVEASTGGKNGGGDGNVEDSTCGKNGCSKFALETTEPLDDKGSMYWNGASEVDWYYQVDGVHDNATSFEKYGGFVLKGTLGTSKLEIDNERANPVMTLQFGEPFRISAQTWNDCVNPAPVTFQHMLDKGVRQYCWETDHDKCERGCFFYNTDSGYQGFAVHDFAFHSLGPFHLEERSDLVAHLGKVNRSEFFAQSQNEQGKTLQLALLSNQGSDFWLGAHEVDWAYQGVNVAEDAGSFEKYGGFVLIDDNGTVSHALEIFMSGSLDKHELTIQFGDPFHVSEEKWNNCQNPASITINGLLDMGAQQYCWEADADKCKRGCFLYKTTKGYQGFAVKPYSFDKLGPFKLTERPDLKNFGLMFNSGGGQVNRSWTHGGLSGRLVGTTQLSDDAKNFWITDENFVLWAYPSDDADNNATDSWEKTGGFLTVPRNGSGYVTYIIDGSQSEADADKIVNFGPPFHVTKEEWDQCGYSKPITLPALLSQNVMEYCWYPVADACCTAGCFFYRTQEGYQGFGVKV